MPTLTDSRKPSGEASTEKTVSIARTEYGGLDLSLPLVLGVVAPGAKKTVRIFGLLSR
jgi:hypothetical protein